MKVAVQFCGGCNPRIDRGSIALEIKQVLTGQGHEIVFNSISADFVVFLSGCLSNCAFKHNPVEMPHVTVASFTLDCVDIPSDRIVPEILMKVRQFYERLES